MSTKDTAIYARVSSKQQDTKSQEPDLQRWAESHEGKVTWYRDKFTGKTMRRPGWSKLEADLRAGKIGTLVVWRLDRLGRTARELLALRDELIQRKVEFVVVASGMMGLDTPEGRLMFGVIAQFAEFDNEVRSERVRAGQAVAKSEGKTWGGSKPGVRKKVTPTQAKMIRRMHEEKEPIARIAKALSLSRPTIYDVLASVPLHTELEYQQKQKQRSKAQ